MIKYILVLMLFSSLEAKIIEVNQLFNKKLVKVKQEQIGTVMSFYGSTTMDESKIVDVVTRFDGFITKLNANKELMAVKKGETLFTIYSDKVLSIQKELQVSKIINKNLYQSALDKLVALDIHKDEIHKLKNSPKSLKDIALKSPINGIVLKKNINQGSFVKTGKLLYQLANIDTLWFVAQVYQKDLPFIQKEMNGLITLDGYSNKVKTKVDYIYPFIDKNKKTVNVRFIVQNSKMELYPNMFGEVKLKNSKRSMLTLPKTAVLTKGSNYYVFKPVSNEEFEPIAVEAKRISSSKYEIIKGLNANDEVINNALFLLDSDAVTNGLYEEDDDDW